MQSIKFQHGLLALALCVPGAGLAAEATPAATPVAKSSTAPTSALAPLAKPADTTQARAELDQMRVQMRELSRKMAELSTQMGDMGPRAYAYRYLGDPERGMVGVVLESNDRGLRVSAVTPSGPADKAGIKAGDVIAAVDGKSLVDEKNDRSLHGVSLGDLKIGQTLKLRVLHDGKPSELTLKAERREPYNLAFAFGDPDGPGFQEMQTAVAAAIPPDLDRQVRIEVENATREATRAAREGEQAAHEGERAARSAMIEANVARVASESTRRKVRSMSFSTPWWGLNLVSLNPDLGGYFGADHGVLVLSADSDAMKSLKPGDVLLDIGGQKVERPEDALRLLREQSTNGEVKLQVLRQHKNQTLSMKSPKFDAIFMPAPPAPEPPVPPAPPPPPPPPPTPPVHATHATPPVPPVPPAPAAPDDDVVVE